MLGVGEVFADLFEALVNFVEYASLVEHLAAITMLVVVGDVVTKLARQLTIDHVLFNLFELHQQSHSAATYLRCIEA